MKKMKKFWVLLMVLAMIIALPACGIKSMDPIDEGDFEDIMDDLDYNVYDYGSSSKRIDEYFYAYDDDGDFEITFILFDEDYAEDEWADRVYMLDDAKKDGEFDGKIKKTGSGSNRKIVVEGEFDKYSQIYNDSEIYMVAILADNMIIEVSTESLKDKDMEEVNDIISELGY